MRFVLLLVSWSMLSSPLKPGVPEQNPVLAFGSAEFDTEYACKAAILALQTNYLMQMAHVKYEALCVPKG